MSAKRQIRLDCDYITMADKHCEFWICFYTTSFYDARRLATKHGWTENQFGFDRCPKHKRR